MLKKEIVKSSFEKSPHTEFVSQIGDFAHDYELTYPDWSLNLPSEWSIIAIVGESGTGKSGLLKKLKKEPNKRPEWNERPIVEHIHEDPETACKYLGSVGLNCLPTWLKNYSVLSLGEKYRASVAWILSKEEEIYLDEYTSTLDRDNAMSLSISLHKSIHRENKKLIVATCHRDIIEHLKPCYVVDLDKEQVFDTRGWQRQSRTIELYQCDRSYWKHFAQYHYLTSDIPSNTQAFILKWKEREKIIGFTSCMTLPSGTLKNAYIASRTVILPQFQGMGFGSKATEILGEYITGQGYRLFSKTSHPIVGQYRENSDRWRATSKNKKIRKDYKIDRSDFFSKGRSTWEIDRLVYSHEYIGGTSWIDRSPKQLSLF